MTAASPIRVFGFWTALALVVGNMIGSGFFLLPAQLAPFGWNGVAGWLVTSAGAMCLAIVFAALARALPKAGGPYAFARGAFGPFAGFVVAWSYWVSMWIGNAAIATGVMAPLSTIFPVISDSSTYLTLILVWGVTAISCFGAGLAGRVQLVTTLIKVIPLLAVVALAAWLLASGEANVPPVEFERFALSGETGIAGAAALTLWAFLGLESATVPAERVVDPERTIARATLTGVGVTALVYIFACSAVAMLADPEEIARSGAPMADFVRPFWGETAGFIIALFAAVAAFGALNGWILMQGELPWAMARDGVFPFWLSRLSRFGTPVRAHVTASAMLSAVILLNAFRSMSELFGFLILLATTASLVAYLTSSLAALKLNAGRGWQRPVFAAAALFSAWTIWAAGLEPAMWGAALLATGIPFYFIARSSRAAAAAPAAPPGSAA